MIDFSKPVETRSGFDATILMTDGSGEFPVAARIVAADGKVTLKEYTTEGRFYLYGHDSSWDLINVSERVHGWLNVYAEETVFHPTKEDADFFGEGGSRLACIPVDIAYTVGDGLEQAAPVWPKALVIESKEVEGDLDNKTITVLKVGNRFSVTLECPEWPAVNGQLWVTSPRDLKPSFGGSLGLVQLRGFADWVSITPEAYDRLVEALS